MSPAFTRYGGTYRAMEGSESFRRNERARRTEARGSVRNPIDFAASPTEFAPPLPCTHFVRAACNSASEMSLFSAILSLTQVLVICVEGRRLRRIQAAFLNAVRRSMRVIRTAIG